MVQEFIYDKSGSLINSRNIYNADINYFRHKYIKDKTVEKYHYNEFMKFLEIITNDEVIHYYS